MLHKLTVNYLFISLFFDTFFMTMNNIKSSNNAERVNLKLFVLYALYTRKSRVCILKINYSYFF